MHEILEFIEGTRERGATKVQVGDKVKKVWNLLNCILQFATLQIWLLILVPSLDDSLAIANTASERCYATVIEHEIHRHVESIYTVAVDLLMDLR